MELRGSLLGGGKRAAFRASRLRDPDLLQHSPGPPSDAFLNASMPMPSLQDAIVQLVVVIKKLAAMQG